MLNDLLESLDFTPAKYREGHSSVADLFKSGQRCGIYILHFNNEFYADTLYDY